jgi:hypothetical protein
MKFLSILALAALSTGAFAAEDLNAMKSKAVTHIDNKMNSLTNAKSCVNGAQTVEKFKACKYDMKEEMMKQKMEAMEEKKNETTEE